jgi:hypothetical protein
MRHWVPSPRPNRARRVHARGPFGRTRRSTSLIVRQPGRGYRRCDVAATLQQPPVDSGAVERVGHRCHRRLDHHAGGDRCHRRRSEVLHLFVVEHQQVLGGGVEEPEDSFRTVAHSTRRLHSSGAGTVPSRDPTPRRCGRPAASLLGHGVRRCGGGAGAAGAARVQPAVGPAHVGGRGPNWVVGRSHSSGAIRSESVGPSTVWHGSCVCRARRVWRDRN